MNVSKIKTHVLEKCYSIALLEYNQKKHILVAAEKINKCYMFDMLGNLEQTLWSEPGGVMSMVQIPNTNGCFLAIHKFYSPNDSKEAKIVLVTPKDDGSFAVKTIINLPHVHRFDIIKREGIYYFIAATLCSGRDFKDDWSYKGKVYACKLPDDLSVYSEENQLKMEIIKEDLLKNHGYEKVTIDGYECFLTSSEEGVFKFIPPSKEGNKWEIIRLIDEPTSDITFVDLDGDGSEEIVTFSPFHGASLKVYKLFDNMYKKVYEYENEFDFAHAMWSGKINGENIAILGNREKDRQLIGLRYEDGHYMIEVYDSNVGPANVFSYEYEGKNYIVSTNRETDEIAWYVVD